jgi:hypothetical protein
MQQAHSISKPKPTVKLTEDTSPRSIVSKHTSTKPTPSFHEEVKEPLLLLPKKTPIIEKSKFPSIIEESIVSSRSLVTSEKSI